MTVHCLGTSKAALVAVTVAGVCSTTQVDKVVFKGSLLRRPVWNLMSRCSVIVLKIEISSIDEPKGTRFACLDSNATGPLLFTTADRRF